MSDDAAAAGRHHLLTEQVVASFADAPSSRVREIMQSLVRHLHAFATEVRLTEAEWATGVDVLTRAGRITDERRQEFVLRPAHIHFMISAAGYRTLTTHVFAADDPHLDDDAVFGVRTALIADFVEHPPGTAPPGGPVDAPWSSLTYPFVLEKLPLP